MKFEHPNSTVVMPRRKILIISSCDEDWGGSEELWGKCIPHLQASNFSVTVIKRTINRMHPKFAALADSGVELVELEQTERQPHWLVKRINRKVKNGLKRLKLYRPKTVENPYLKIISAQSADFAIVSQGINFDGLYFAHLCSLISVPYVIVAQKAIDFFWPSGKDRHTMIQTLQKATHCFFVSQHNLKLTEMQFGMRLKNASVVFNPVKLPVAVMPYPTTKTGFKIACVGRLYVMDKGQDMLLKILACDKWKQRDITISFIGSGIDEDALKALSALLHVTNVEFTGYIEDIASVWRNHHALILPSRSEGLPLSMVEAMAAGRPVIVTRAGGNEEFVDDGVTGFIGQANEEALDEAMERAWNNRHYWQEIGKAACEFITSHVPAQPENEFAKKVIALSVQATGHRQVHIPQPILVQH